MRDGFAGEEPLPCEHLVEYHTERLDVAALVRYLAASLLRGHVGRCFHDHAHLRGSSGERGRLGWITRGTLVQRLRQAKVQDLDGPVLFDLDVGGLQVPMGDSGFMRGYQGVGDLFGDG